MPEMEIKPVDKKQALDNLTLATLDMSSADIAALKPREVDALTGVTGLSVGFVQNMQRSMVIQAEGLMMQNTAYDIVKRLQGGFPDIAAIPTRDRTIKVWLDGLPEEIEI